MGMGGAHAAPARPVSGSVYGRARIRMHAAPCIERVQAFERMRKRGGGGDGCCSLRPRAHHTSGGVRAHPERVLVSLEALRGRPAGPLPPPPPLHRAPPPIRSCFVLLAPQP